MRIDELSTLENDRLDYKKKLPEVERLARQLIAFANSKGGKIIVGYDEVNKSVVGILPDQRVEEHIANVAAEVCTPRIDYTLSYESAEQKTLLIIDVNPGSAKPYYIKKLGLEAGVYIRIGSTCRLADDATLKRLIREGQNISFDGEPSTLTKSQLSRPIIDQYLALRKERLGTPLKILTPELMQDLDLTTKDLLTIAGALLFSEAPQKARELGQAFIKAARFKGTERGQFIDQQEISGPLPQQIENAAQFVLKHSNISSKVSGLRRTDEPEYAPEIIRELITNAVIHRDYSILGESIQLAIFDDRLEITSPGGLPGTVTVENLSNRQCSRNPIIAKRMFEMGYNEAWGLGIDEVIKWCKLKNRPLPLFIDANDQFSCTIYGKAHEKTSSLSKEAKLSELEIKALNHIEENGSISNRECRENFNLSKTQAQTLLQKLLKMKLIRVRGKGPSTIYLRQGK